MGKTSKARVASIDLSGPLPDDSYSCSLEDDAPDDSHQDEHGQCSTELESDVPVYILTKMLKDVGFEVPKSVETRSKCSIHADKGRG